MISRLGVAALAAAVAVGAASGTLTMTNTATAWAEPLVTAPAPLAPTSTLPTAEELGSILENLADPNVDDEIKSNLVVGGMDHHRANVLNRKLRQAAHRGELPLQFEVSNIAEAGGPANVNTEVTVSGPALGAPITRAVGFSYQNGAWLLAQADADELVEDIVGRLPG